MFAKISLRFQFWVTLFSNLVSLAFLHQMLNVALTLVLLSLFSFNYLALKGRRGGAHDLDNCHNLTHLSPKKTSNRLDKVRN